MHPSIDLTSPSIDLMSRITIKPKFSTVAVLKPESYFLLRFEGFDAHHAALKGAPGQRISDLESIHTTVRVRYQNGAIYMRPDGGFAWVYGAIGARYDELGGPSSYLGIPLSDEVEMSEGGRASVFERGSIYWWPDVGAIDLNHVVVHYTGLICFGETDTDGFGSDSDEPFVILGVVSPAASLEVRTQIYDDVDGGEGRPDLIELYRGKPTGISLAVLLVEHDEGDPDKYRAEVGKFVDEGMKKLAPAVAKALLPVPYVGPLLAMAASEGLPLLVPVISDFVNDLAGTGDEVLGRQVVSLTAKDMVVLSARTLNSNSHGLGFKAETPLISSQGASYKIYFGLVTA